MIYLGLLNAVFVFGSFYIFLLRSWVGEDAFIFFRYVDNFINGHGLVFNVGERVEGFTSPLWVFFLSIFREVFGSNLRPMSILLGLLLSTIAIYLLIGHRRQKDNLFFPLGIALLVTNSAFRDFATSGFETSLTYLLVAISSLYILKNGFYHRPWVLSSILSLLVLNRPETLLLWVYVSFCYVLRFLKEVKKDKVGSLKELASYLIPAAIILGGYQIFRMGYFASFFPNTFYAKKGGEFYAKQGAYYLLDFARSYPISIFVFAVSLYVLVISTFKNSSFRYLFISNYHLLAMAALNTAYVLYAGGDYMHGRFLLVPFMLAAIALSDSTEGIIYNYAKKYNFLGAKLTLTLLPILAVVWILSYFQQPYSVVAGKQIAHIKDERAHFNYNFLPEKFKEYISEPITNEFNWMERGLYYKDIAAATNSPISVVMPNIGFFGYAAGEKVNVMGGILTDPYLARFPIEVRGTIGHENSAHNDYTLSRRPTFAYTPFIEWNVPMHQKFDRSEHSFVITGDDNDSFIPLFDLSNKDFLSNYQTLTEGKAQEQLDLAINEFLNISISQIMLSGPQEAVEIMGLLKLYWYPYTSSKNKELFDRTRAEKFGTHVLSSYEVFDFYLKPESDELWRRITGRLNVGSFVSNVFYALGQETKVRNVLPVFFRLNSNKPASESVKLSDISYNKEYKLFSVPSGKDAGSLTIKVDNDKFKRQKYTLKLEYRVEGEGNELRVENVFTHKIGVLGPRQKKMTVYLDITEPVIKAGGVTISLSRPTGPAPFGVEINSLEIF